MTAFIPEVRSDGGYKGCIYRVSDNALHLGTTALYCRARPHQRNPIDRTLGRETDRTKRRVTPVSRFASALIITAHCRRRPVPGRKDDKSAPAPVRAGRTGEIDTTYGGSERFAASFRRRNFTGFMRNQVERTSPMYALTVQRLPAENMI